MRILRILAGVVLVAVGGGLLAAIVPHEDVAGMRNIRIVAESGVKIVFRWWPGGGLTLGASRFIQIYAVVLLALLMLWPITRRLCGYWLASARRWLAGLLSLAVLVLTLWPSKTLNTPDTWPITVYQMLGVLAFLFLVAGMQGLLAGIGGRSKSQNVETQSAVLSPQSSPPTTTPHPTPDFSTANHPITRSPDHQIRYQPAFSALRFLQLLWLYGSFVVRRCPLGLFLAVLFAAQLFVCARYSILLFDRLPHVIDSIAQLFHAHIFALGLWTAPAPPLPEFFQMQHIIIGDRWYSQYPPGHSLLLYLGLAANHPWLVNPLLGALTVVVVYAAGRELYGDLAGRLASLLTLASPFITFMSSEYMNHTTGLLCFTGFVWQFARAVRRGSVLSGLAAGFCGGYFLLTRPFSAAAMLLPFAVYAAWLLIRRFRALWPALAGMLAVGLLLAGALFWFNWATNGSPWRSGFEVKHGVGVLPGFGHSGWGPLHTVRQANENTLRNLAGLNKFLFEWPIPSLFFAALLFAVGKKNRWDWLLLSTCVLLTGAYWTYWYQDWTFGPRFLYEASAALILLTVRGLIAGAGFLAEALPAGHSKAGSLLRPAAGIGVRQSGGGAFSAQRRLASLSLTSVVLGCVAIGWGGSIPWLKKEYKNYYGVDARLLDAVKEEKLSRALVFCTSRLTSAYAFNPPLLDGPVIYVRDLGGHNADLARLFPGRKCYLEVNGQLHPINNLRISTTGGTEDTENYKELWKQKKKN